MKDLERINLDKQESQQKINQFVNRKGELGIWVKNQKSLMAEKIARFEELEKEISTPRKKYESQLWQVESEI